MWWTTYIFYISIGDVVEDLLRLCNINKCYANDVFAAFD